MTTLTTSCDGCPRALKRICGPPWGISPTMLWQKAHSRFIIVRVVLRARSSMFLNIFSFSQLGTLCDAQPCCRDTATFVQTPPPEVV